MTPQELLDAAMDLDVCAGNLTGEKEGLDVEKIVEVLTEIASKLREKARE